MATDISMSAATHSVLALSPWYFKNVISIFPGWMLFMVFTRNWILELNLPVFYRCCITHLLIVLHFYAQCCRVCSDCGSRTPGAGMSSRWHAHYTVCDSCYQQRNKGFSCPLCRRAYRAAAYREMVQCGLCRK